MYARYSIAQAQVWKAPKLAREPCENLGSRSSSVCLLCVCVCVLLSSPSYMYMNCLCEKCAVPYYMRDAQLYHYLYIHSL